MNVRRVGILCPKTNANITANVYNDLNELAATSTVSLNTHGWKRINVASSGKLGALVQVDLSYSGTPALRIDQMQIEGVLHAGRRRKPI